MVEAQSRLVLEFLSQAPCESSDRLCKALKSFINHPSKSIPIDRFGNAFRHSLYFPEGLVESENMFEANPQAHAYEHQK